MASFYYAGLSGIKLPTPQADIGDLSLQTTYAHLFSPFMMAFQPAEASKPHPAPWRAVSAGFAVDIYCQLVVPVTNGKDHLDRAIETTWLIATLLRLRLGPHIRAATIASAPISLDSAAQNLGEIWALEIRSAPILNRLPDEAMLSGADIDWLKDHWKQAHKLMRGHRDFRVLLEAYSACSWAKSPGLALVELWGCLAAGFHSESSRGIFATFDTHCLLPRSTGARASQVGRVDSRALWRA